MKSIFVNYLVDVAVAELVAWIIRKIQQRS